MRSVGELSRLAPALTLHDHAVAVGSGAADFARLALHLVAGAPADERVVLCVDTDPRVWDPEQVFAREIEDGRVAVFPVTHAYRPMLRGEPDAGRRQLAMFDHVVDSARADGFRAVRVLADNTALVRTVAGGLPAWLAWEQLTDAWQARRPVSSVCWFDGCWVQPGDLAAIQRRHPVSIGDAPPPWRVFADAVDGENSVAVTGEVDAADADDFGAAIGTAAAVFAVPTTVGGAELVVDAARARFLDHRALEAISRTSRAPGAPRIVLRNASPSVRRLHEVLDGSLELDLV